MRRSNMVTMQSGLGYKSGEVRYGYAIGPKGHHGALLVIGKVSFEAGRVE